MDYFAENSSIGRTYLDDEYGNWSPDFRSYTDRKYIEKASV